MNPVQPRFEFRAWADRLDVVHERISALADPYEIRESVETYIVSAATTEANPKVRGDLLDIKVLIATRDGFEEWEPQLKTSFPIPASVVRNDFFRILGDFTPSLSRDIYSFDQFLDEVVGRHRALAAVEVTKRRRMSTVVGCITEFADVQIGRNLLQTAAVESVDLEALREARALTGLEIYENTSYPAAIKQALGWALPESRERGGEQRGH